MAGKGKGRQDGERLLTAIRYIGEYPELVEDIMATFDSGANDHRSVLTLEPLRWAIRMGYPEVITLEQVPTVLPVWEAYADALQEWGYTVWTGILHAEQYGVPQTRKRAILMAERDADMILPPTPTHSRYYPRSPEKLDEGVLPWVSMAQALGWGMTERPSMTVAGGGTSTGGAEPFGNGARKGMARELGAGRYLRSPQSVAGVGRATREAEQPCVTVTSNFDRATWENGCVRPGDEPAPSMTASMDNGNSRFRERVVSPTGEAIDDWGEVRPATTIVSSFAPEIVRGPGYRKPGDGPCQKAPGSVRVEPWEAGILQSFPADYPWQGSKTKQFQQIGNAVPCLLAKAVVEALL